tara:strand:- start:1152 stop:2297 length:1146 start_codon:yes stop_codon:yes gene_type:complete
MKEERTLRVIQTLEIEDNCRGIYADNQFIFKNFSQLLDSADHAWSYSTAIERDENYTFLSVYANQKQLSEFSRDPQGILSVGDLIRSQKAAALTAKVDLSRLCFFDVLPDHLLHRWFSLRDAAMQEIIRTVPRPASYDIMHKIHVLTTEISKRGLNVGKIRERVKYDIYTSATGRLATVKGSYPIMNIKKEERKSVTPQNDLFLELDLNGAEIRTLLAFSGVQQPTEDIHLWNMKDMPPWISRSEAKAQFFAWLYNPKAENGIYEKHYNKKAYLEHYTNATIRTPFGRALPVDERKALNYLLQSTTSDIVLENAYKIVKKLRGTKSFVAFTMHDSVVLDFAKEDYEMVSQLKDIFETNLFGRFLSNVSIGKNFGEMKEIRV